MVILLLVIITLLPSWIFHRRKYEIRYTTNKVCQERKDIFYRWRLAISCQVRDPETIYSIWNRWYPTILCIIYFVKYGAPITLFARAQREMSVTVFITWRVNRKYRCFVISALTTKLTTKSPKSYTQTSTCYSTQNKSRCLLPATETLIEPSMRGRNNKC